MVNDSALVSSRLLRARSVTLRHGWLPSLDTRHGMELWNQLLSSLDLPLVVINNKQEIDTIDLNDFIRYPLVNLSYWYNQQVHQQ